MKHRDAHAATLNTAYDRVGTPPRLMKITSLMLGGADAPSRHHQGFAGRSRRLQHLPRLVIGCRLAGHCSRAGDAAVSSSFFRRVRAPTKPERCDVDEADPRLATIRPHLHGDDLRSSPQRWLGNAPERSALCCWTESSVAAARTFAVSSASSRPAGIGATSRRSALLAGVRPRLYGRRRQPVRRGALLSGTSPSANCLMIFGTHRCYGRFRHWDRSTHCARL